VTADPVAIAIMPAQRIPRGDVLMLRLFSPRELRAITIINHIKEGRTIIAEPIRSLRMTIGLIAKSRKEARIMPIIINIMVIIQSSGDLIIINHGILLITGLLL
jgi:hypothetical protein